jgi:lipopolysaccharide export system protein LptA
MMRDRVERLRIWVMLGAGGLVLVVAGFLVYAHYRSRAFLAGLPAKLRAEITESTVNYTHSQTVLGRTVFTLHAAQMERRKDGVVVLHDAGVVVYGRKQNRADRIYGKEFEYDQAKGIVRAVGMVDLDLQAPSPDDGKRQRTVNATGSDLAHADPKVLHVKTSGLVYLTDLGVAATGEDLEFSEGAMSGQARGADYNSDTGLISLHSKVRMNGLTSSGPVVVTASTAEMNQLQQVARLTEARMITPAETVNADRAVITLRKDGSPERVQGEGHVMITRAVGGVLTSPTGEVALSTTGRAEHAEFSGGVRYADDEAALHEQAVSADARITFDALGQAQHVSLTGGVQMQQRERGTASEAWSTRNLTAKTVELALGTARVAGSTSAATAKGQGKTELRDAEAIGDARLVMISPASGGAAGTAETDMSGDDLKAHVLDGKQLSDVVGVGHTVLRQVASGVEETSSGDRTELVFRTDGKVAPKTGKGFDGAGQNLASAVQIGHVISVRKGMKQQGTGMVPVEDHATAERADYDGASNQVTLTGGVVMTDTESTLWGSKVVVQRGSGDATAEGGVRVSYAQPGQGGRPGEPIHVISDHAVLKRGAVTGGVKAVGGVRVAGAAGSSGVGDKAFFYGTPGKMARLWQGGSQVEAPVLEFESAARRLTANGPGVLPVHVVLVGSAAEPRAGGVSAARPGQRAAAPSVVRVQSQEMVYTDGLREAEFSGGVQVEDADGTMRAQRAAAYLAAAGTAPTGSGKMGAGAAKSGSEQHSADKTAATPFLGGSLERVVATGKVEIEQPGRRGTGEQLVYTASDGMFVLTGTAAAPPRMEDETRGTTTGAVLRFHAGDDRVEVSNGGIQSGDTQRKRTETRVKQ